MPGVITSTQNPRIKAAARLREARDRREMGLILIDGGRELSRAVEAGIEVQAVFACGLRPESEASRLLKSLEERGVAVFDCAAHAFARLAYGDRDEGVVAVARRPAGTLPGLGEFLDAGGRALVAVVEGVEKPGNLGAILRTADAAGVDAVIAANAATDVFGPNAIRASLGAVFTVRLAEASADETLAFLRGRKMQIVAATPEADALYTSVDMTRATAIVLGAEAGGLSDAWRGEGVQRVRLPMLGRVDSLNVSATAAVMLYEAVRQRGMEVGRASAP